MQPPSVSEAVRGTDPSHKLPLLRREAVQHDIFFNKLPPLRGGSFKCLFSMHTAPCEGRGSVKSPSFPIDCLVRERRQCETHFFSTDCLARERRQCKIHILRTNCLTGKKNSGKGDWIGRCGRAAKYFPEFGEILESENAFCYNQNEQTFEGLA